MTSININRSAMTALQTLRSISSQLDETEARVSTGIKVNNAADNASYWSIASNLKSDTKALSTVSDSIGLGIAAFDTAYNGVDQVKSILDQIKQDLTAARAPAADKSKLNTDIDALKTRLISIVQSSSFNGDNWLYNTSNTVPGTKSIISSFSRDLNNKVTLNSIPVNVSSLTLIDTGSANRGMLTKGIDVTPTIAGSTTTTSMTYFLINASSTTAASGTNTAAEMKLTATTTDVQIDGMLLAVDSILQNTLASGTTLGALSNGAKVQQEFIKTLTDANNKGISALVDADMNEESTRLKALQTQQQLGLQALSIANSEAEKLLVLFR